VKLSMLVLLVVLLGGCTPLPYGWESGISRWMGIKSCGPAEDDEWGFGPHRRPFPSWNYPDEKDCYDAEKENY